MLSKNAKIYIAGHRGLVGSAIWDNLMQRGYTNLIGRTHSELDLTDQYAVRRFFDEEHPEAVVLAAAFVGGRVQGKITVWNGMLSFPMNWNKSTGIFAFAS